jgi:alpha-1,2-mannosyltransferase
MQDAGAREPSSTIAEHIGWERVLLASAIAAAFLVVLTVSGTALATRACGASRAWTSPVVALGTIMVTVAFAPSARRGRGPLSAAARRLPRRLDGGLRRRRVAAGLAGLLAVVAVAQVARLSCFMADPALRWGSAYPPVEFGVRHMCLSAYVWAADLTRSGVPNVYAEEHYPAYGEGEAEETPSLTSGVANLAPHIRDAFEYPPPFLLLPRAALVLTNDFLSIRTGWFMLQTALFMAFALILASRIGGPRGMLAGLLLPGLLSSFPFMFNFQFGQFQLAAVMLAAGGMLAISGGRDRLGGALLGGAVVTKIFPALLLLYLAFRRRGRPILWTLGFAVAYAFAGLIVLGPAPYRAFFLYHLPRVASGEAFSFFVSSDLTLAANASVFSIPFKLARLGVPAMSEAVASELVWLYTALLVAATIVAARRRRDSSLEPLVWLGLLSLGALRSPDAPNVYVGTSALWLLTLLAVETRGRIATVALLVAAWICISVQPPLPDPRATIALWMSGQVAMLVLGFWVVLRRQVGVITGNTAHLEYSECAPVICTDMSLE